MEIPSDILALHSVEDILSLILRKSPNCGLVPNFDISAPTILSYNLNFQTYLRLKVKHKNYSRVRFINYGDIYEFRGQYHLELVYLYNSTKQTRMRQTRMRQTRTHLRL